MTHNRKPTSEWTIVDPNAIKVEIIKSFEELKERGLRITRMVPGRTSKYMKAIEEARKTIKKNPDIPMVIISVTPKEGEDPKKLTKTLYEGIKGYIKKHKLEEEIGCKTTSNINNAVPYGIAVLNMNQIPVKEI